MRPLTLAHLTLLDAGPEALIDAAASAGFDAIGLRLVAPLPGDGVFPLVGRPEAMRAVKAAQRAGGISVLDIEAVWLRPDTRVESLRPVLEAGAELGARYLLTVGFDPERARLIENLGRLCDSANGVGLRPMFEFIPYSSVPDLAAALDLLRGAGARDAGLLIDALHLRRSGGHPRDLAAIDPALLSYGQICDAPLAPPADGDLRHEAREDRRLPGEGELWLEDLIRALPPDVPLAVEAPCKALRHLSHHERARLAAEAARRVLARMA
ncbi:MAG: TIM barrel protein [Alphaproteobacteria bacterium]|nr:TIM barrel protein [Alphaproteobacteria bacterium]